MRTADVARRLIEMRVQVEDRLVGILPRTHWLRKLSGKMRFVSAVDGFKDSMAIGAALEMGLFRALRDGPMSVADAAKVIGAPEPNTEVLLRTLAALGLVRRADDLWRAEAIAERLGADDVWDPYRAHVDILLGSWNAWRELPVALRSGEGHPAIRVYNEANPLTAAYVRWSCATLEEPARQLVARLDLDGVERMIAGTVGVTFVKAVQEARPGVEVTISCLPHLIRELPAALEHFGVPEPAETIVNTGDADTDTWGSEEKFDLVFLARKFAYCGPEHAVAYLRKTAEVLSEQGMLVVWEPVEENWTAMPPMPERIALTDTMMGEGRPLYRKSEITAFLREAGYSVAVHDVTAGASTFFVATRG